jgi:hypothetical protein
MGPPGSQQVSLGAWRAGEYSEKSHQGVTAGARGLAGSQDSSGPRRIGRIEEDDGGVEQSTLPVVQGRREASCLFQSPGCRYGLMGGGYGGSFEFTS